MPVTEPTSQAASAVLAKSCILQFQCEIPLENRKKKSRSKINCKFSLSIEYQNHLPFCLTLIWVYWISLRDAAFGALRGTPKQELEKLTNRIAKQDTLKWCGKANNEPTLWGWFLRPICGIRDFPTRTIQVPSCCLWSLKTLGLQILPMERRHPCRWDPESCPADFGGLGILGIQLVSPWGTSDEFSIQQFEVLSPQNATRNATRPAALLVAAAAHHVAGDLWLLKSSCPTAPGIMDLRDFARKLFPDFTVTINYITYMTCITYNMARLAR